jgi:hypothetical protein
MPAVVNAGNVIVFNALPIVTPPVDVPVLMLVAKFELLFRLTAAPVTDNPDDPVNNPAEVIVPVPLVEILPLVVTASPAVVGERIIPERFQYPRIPVVGGVDVNALVPFVYTPEFAVNPLTVNPTKVGDDVVFMFCGVERVMLPLPLVTIT